MRIHINGNLGYIGPVLVHSLRKSMPEAVISGFDTAFFTGCLVNPILFPEKLLDVQYYGDIRKPTSFRMYEGVDTVIHLAAISNDPMGKEFEAVTHQVNTDAVYQSAIEAKNAGVSHFVFASSCSVYGAGGDDAKTETSELNPLTAYAKSKVNAEERLQEMADENFIVTCLRFATACGWSPRLRLDLVLNDFIVSALVNKKINILSDGTPWRPLIHVKDMARAMEWASKRSKENGGEFLIVNTGSNDWNFQVKDLAFAVRDVLRDVEVNVNENAAPDKRSYKVDFSKFTSLAIDFLPIKTLSDTVMEMQKEIQQNIHLKTDLELNHLIRLKVLSDLIKIGKLKDDLTWIV